MLRLLVDRFALPVFTLLITAILMWFVGAPSWAVVGFSYIAYLITLKREVVIVG